MHIPDGFISPAINLAGYAVSAGACAYGVYRANRDLGERQVPLLGVTAAFIFAAQMLNFPVAGGTSGHFLGAALAAVLLGPWNACLILAIVLVTQCLGFADGGLTALGTNILNMGVFGGIIPYFVFLAFKRLLPKNRFGFLASVSAFSWLSVMFASTACALELAFSGTSPLHIVIPAMVGVHALIGLGEALITTTVVATVMAARKDLIYQQVEAAQ